MTARPRPKKIDWGMANFVFGLTMAILLGFSAYWYFNGRTGERLERLERDVAALRADLHEVERRLR